MLTDFVDGRISADDFEKQLSELQLTSDERACRDALLGIAAKEAELYVGGDETPFMLQYHAVQGDDDDSPNVDLTCTILLPHDDICVFWCGRAVVGLNAAVVYWRERLDAPVLIPVDENKYEYALASLRGKQWTRGPFSLAQVRKLRQWCEQDGGAELSSQFLIETPKRHLPGLLPLVDTQNTNANEIP
jgi:hypothetical protein